jgi:hypothetical protein
MEGVQKEAGIRDWVRNWWHSLTGKKSVDSLTELEQQSPPEPEMPQSTTQMPTFGVPPVDPQEDVQLPTITRNDLGQILEDNINEEQVGEDDLLLEEQQEPLVEETIPREQVEQPEIPVEEEKKGRPPENAPDGQKMIWAEQNREVVQITYTTLKNNVVSRVVEPHGRFYARTTHRTIMVTFDQTVGDVRAFVMTRIAQVRFIDRKFTKKFNVSTR